MVTLDVITGRLDLIGNFVPLLLFDELFDLRLVALDFHEKLRPHMIDAAIEVVRDPVFRTGDFTARSLYKSIRALVLFTEKGHRKAINAVSARLNDHRANVGRVAAAALPQLANRGDQEVIKELSFSVSCYCDEYAAQALGHLAETGDRRAVAALRDYLDFPEDQAPWRFRVAALKALGHIMDTSDQRTIAAILGSVDDRHLNVRRAAILTLARLTETGDRNVIAVVRTSLNDRVADIRCAAINALSHITAEGDAMTVEAVRSCVEDRNPNVRGEAIRALVRMVQRGDASTVSCLRAHLKDRVPRVRCAVVFALAQLASHGDRSVIVAFTKRMLRDPAACVRHAAKRAQAMYEKQSISVI